MITLGIYIQYWITYIADHLKTGHKGVYIKDDETVQFMINHTTYINPILEHSSPKRALTRALTTENKTRIAFQHSYTLILLHVPRQKHIMYTNKRGK